MRRGLAAAAANAATSGDTDDRLAVIAELALLSHLFLRAAVRVTQSNKQTAIFGCVRAFRCRRAELVTVLRRRSICQWVVVLDAAGKRRMQ